MATDTMAANSMATDNMATNTLASIGTAALTGDASAERAVTHVVETEVADLDEQGWLKPPAYLRLFARIAEEHLNGLGLNVDATLRYHLAWALVSMSFEILQPVSGCVRLHATTWYSQKRGPYFRRELEFRNDEGQLVFHGSTFSVLLDVDTRTVYRKREAPFPITPPESIFTIDAAPSMTHDIDYQPLERRHVRNSHIDALGHVNNTRYAEFAYDALTPEELDRLPSLHRMDVQFVSELRKGDIFLVEKALADTRIGVRGKDATSDGIAFSFVMTFRDA